jgi:hypothetical protein
MDIRSMDGSAKKWNDPWEILKFYAAEKARLPLTNQDDLEEILALNRKEREEISAFYDALDAENRKRHEERLAFYAAQPAVAAYRPSLSERGFWEWLQIIGFILFIAFVVFNDDGTSTGPSCTPYPMGGCQEEDY